MGQKKIKYWYKEIPQELKSVLGSSKFKISLSKLEKKEHRDADRILTLAAKEIFVNINLFDRQKAKEFLKVNLFNTLLKNKGINKMNLEDFKSKKETQQEQEIQEKDIITLEKVFEKGIKNANFKSSNKLQMLEKKGIDISQKPKKDSTVRQYEATLNHLKKFFGENKNIKEISREDARDFQIYLFEKGLDPVGINKYINQIKKFFTILVKDRILQFNDFDIEKLEEDNDKKDMFTNEDIKLILSKLDGEFKTIFEFGIYTGMRISEILDIKIKHIEEDILLIPWSKTGKKRETVIHKNINLDYGKITELKINGGEYLNQYLFFYDTLKNRVDIAEEINDVIKEILKGKINFEEKDEEEIKEELRQIKRKSFHSTRSSFRTFLENTETKDSFINDLMGHSQRGMGNIKYVKNRDINIKREIINSVHYSIEK